MCSLNLRRRAISPRDDQKIGITPRTNRRFDFPHHLLDIDKRFAGEMSATFGNSWSSM